MAGYIGLSLAHNRLLDSCTLLTSLQILGAEEGLKEPPWQLGLLKGEHCHAACSCTGQLSGLVGATGIYSTQGGTQGQVPFGLCVCVQLWQYQLCLVPAPAHERWPRLLIWVQGPWWAPWLLRILVGRWLPQGASSGLRDVPAPDVPSLTTSLNKLLHLLEDRAEGGCNKEGVAAVDVDIGRWRKHLPWHPWWLWQHHTEGSSWKYLLTGICNCWVLHGSHCWALWLSPHVLHGPGGKGGTAEAAWAHSDLHAAATGHQLLLRGAQLRRAAAGRPSTCTSQHLQGTRNVSVFSTVYVGDSCAIPGGEIKVQNIQREGEKKSTTSLLILCWPCHMECPDLGLRDKGDRGEERQGKGKGRKGRSISFCNSPGCMPLMLFCVCAWTAILQVVTWGWGLSRNLKAEHEAGSELHHLCRISTFHQNFPVWTARIFEIEHVQAWLSTVLEHLASDCIQAVLEYFQWGGLHTLFCATCSVLVTQ